MRCCRSARVTSWCDHRALQTTVSVLIVWAKKRSKLCWKAKKKKEAWQIPVNGFLSLQRQRVLLVAFEVLRMWRSPVLRFNEMPGIGKIECQHRHQRVKGSAAEKKKTRRETVLADICIYQKERETSSYSLHAVLRGWACVVALFPFLFRFSFS